MIVKIKRQEIELLTCIDLSKKCFEPLILLYKKKATEQPNDTQLKEQFYKQLTEGQRALFMFYAYYNHVSKSIIEFYWWSAYFFAQPKSWSAIKAGMRYFKDEAMLLLLEEIEQELRKHNHPNTLETFTITREDLYRTKEFQATIQSLHVLFEKTSPFTISNINDYIQKNLQEFVEIEE